MKNLVSKIIVSLIIIAPIFFSIACIEEIEFQPPNEFQNSIIIEGKVVKGNPSTVEVSTQNIFDFSFEEVSFFNALEVFVLNDNGQKLLVPKTTTGNYKLRIDPSSGFEVEYGGSYGIEVHLLDGRSYQSELELLIPVPKLESLDHKLLEREEENEAGIRVPVSFVEYRLSSQLVADQNQERTDVRWILESVYKQSDLIARDQCYVKKFENPGTILLVEKNDNSRTKVEDELILEQVVSRIMVEGQYVTVIQESLDNRAVEYWKQIQELSTNNGTFYEAPPGQVKSNIKKLNEAEGEVFGFFYATEHDSLHAFVDSTFVDFYTEICPHPDNVERESNDFGPCDDCCYCLWLDNSSTSKPSFWVD